MDEIQLLHKIRSIFGLKYDGLGNTNTHHLPTTPPTLAFNVQ